MRRLLLLGLVAAAAAAPAAHATNECRGLTVCVPVAGPWVLAGTAAQVEYQLSCPRNFVVAGLDAEVSVRGVDVGFVGALGSPVNPGITTTRDAVFLGRLVRARTPAASFRPHIGCIPAAGGGSRAPTVHHAFAPGKPVDRRVVQVVARNRTVTARCPKGERLAGTTHAIAFPGATPPTDAQARAVRATVRTHAGTVRLTIRSKTRGAVVQLSLLCGPR